MEYGVGEVLVEMMTNTLDPKLPNTYRITVAKPEENYYQLTSEVDHSNTIHSKQDLDVFFRKTIG